MAEQKIIRCAIYTRKSCEDGLEQEFNSLDAQRIAGENYVASQIHENWRLISKHYDDGGFSGGNMNRPALQELFDDIRAGNVDMVVVYKIDRLSRSLFDFSKIVELFDKYGVSFVSVTQSFNTSNSSGKLMLNILLSFAQFEREITSERIRDKFASSLKKGLWMGGVVPLGYEVKERKLVIKEDEAKIIRFIYDNYLKTESYFKVREMLNDMGYRTKIKPLKSGGSVGGQLFEPKAVLRILRNPYYKGCVKHKDKIYSGEHEAIIDETTWERVQEIFERRSKPEMRNKLSKTPSFLRGLVWCDACNSLMKQTVAARHGLRYRYYTCLKHIKFKNCKSERSNVPADPIEQQVIAEIVRILKSPEVIMALNKVAEERKNVEKSELMNALKHLNEVWKYLYQAEQFKVVRMLVKKVRVNSEGLKIDLNLEGLDNLMLQLAS